MRLNNFISSTGICSRREADELIKQKKVKVNGEIAPLGYIVNSKDKIEVNGKLLQKKKNDIYIALNKPVGITCTTERHIKGNIIDFINHTERIFPIGRLDKDSEGLILLTNDGSIVNEILREENNHEKDYIVTVNKPITPAFINGMSKGVKIYNPVKNQYTITNKCKVVKINSNTFKITLSQGLNRQIRRMCSSFSYKVVKLKRIRIINITLKGLNVGKWRNLTDEEVRILRSKNN
ncbi:23S rRNA pseudouridine synthase F [Clostridium tetani]|uniref:Pseudouridine synthase n=1 Tax=Clostridium tetani (strain Massachusetts / E88) TaxID=212717 RepID=Q899L7_CLOTE|nr:pseudouridine synthase [Clostridium tetani]AAO34807.1 tRNA pseudouridine synthase A [Clostridium tetani E88]KGI36500.1 pseudouridine synthase [Clostridium tetani]KGI38820.1 pseudouridine synthase [Clostridium tetani ATCC 9441]KGI42580.1 pseudouridine synthase [Clostridium tetani]KHO38697.1 pseudouridine synthase [Clostridium tetani]